MGKSGPRLRPVSSLKSRSGLWYRTQASAAQKDNAIKTATKYSSAHNKKRAEDNKMRKLLKIKKGSWMNASRKKGGGWTVQRDYINKAANGSGKRSRYSA